MSSIVMENIPTSEKMYFLQCPMCQQWMDKRNSKEFFKHVHGLDELSMPATAILRSKAPVEIYAQEGGNLALA